MYEIRDDQDRLIVVMPIRDKHYGLLNYVFIDGHVHAQYKTFGEAARHARDLANGVSSGSSELADRQTTS
jgi:prepilin-type processing-associated H-X9-DG protein